MHYKKNMPINELFHLISPKFSIDRISRILEITLSSNIAEIFIENATKTNLRSKLNGKIEIFRDEKKGREWKR